MCCLRKIKEVLARVIKALHGEDGKIGKKTKSCYSSIWLDIIQEVKRLKSRGIDLTSLSDVLQGESLEGSGDFSVASVRNLIDGITLPEVLTKTRWIKEVPIKINVHAWKVKIDCLPTRLNISRRGMDIDSILCPMCGTVVESTRHLFFTCHISRDILQKISRWWDIEYTEIASYEECWTDSQFDSIVDDVYTTFFEKVEPEKVEPEKAEPEKPAVIVIGSSSSKLECSSTSELECSSTLESSSSDESSSSNESSCLEKSVLGSMKMAVSQKGPSKDLLYWYKDVNDQDEEETDKEDDEIDKQDDEIDDEAKDGKDDSHDELWSPKTIGTTTMNLISPKMKG
ncbi:RNA-directed DNA polymerase, eukaryota [Tanacetum coccineum]|uniref:RNA-directed DNA polymerase, eukaryota n=1 Tax=Tanacetum coccineum TaxID=301880 RepID=A0ABQ5BL56_9ASTR